MAISILPTISTNSDLVRSSNFDIKQHKMKPNETNRAIAELCGWIPTQTTVTFDGGWECTETRWAYPGKGSGHFNQPNYHGSLDACAEFEATIATPSDKCAYIVILDRVITGPGIVATSGAFSQTTATAPQRCEAFLRMHGKWIDNE